MTEVLGKEMLARVAIVTDAVSSDFIFPFWYRYYSGLFGAKNIFVVTYDGLSAAFGNYLLGGLVQVPMGYEDELRKTLIGRFVSSLLSCYDTVVRVDVDEFLVVDPQVGGSLVHLIEHMDNPYMTARGFDVIQMPDELPLPEFTNGPLMVGRSFAYPNTALNKTCIVKTPVEWSAGFHFCNVVPRFGALFLLHMKRIDINWQLAWFSRMLDLIQDNPKVHPIFKSYYAPDQEKIYEYHKAVATRPRLHGIESWYRADLIERFLDNIRLSTSSGLYHGEHGHELVLCEIPKEWKDAV